MHYPLSSICKTHLVLPSILHMIKKITNTSDTPLKTTLPSIPQITLLEYKQVTFVKEARYGKEKILHWICKRLFDFHCFMDIDCFADQIFVPLADFFDRNDFL